MRLREYLVVITLSVCMGGLLGFAAGHSGPDSGFNDGFSDSKLDDCQQGFVGACEWLQHTK